MATTLYIQRFSGNMFAVTAEARTPDEGPHRTANGEDAPKRVLMELGCPAERADDAIKLLDECGRASIAC